MYTLSGDRNIEYSWAAEKLPPGNGDYLLDFGCGSKAHMTKHAVIQGYAVHAIDLTPLGVTLPPGAIFIQGDILKTRFHTEFDVVLNISTIEHVGIAGRYGVSRQDDTADFTAMLRLRSLMSDKAIQILTLPVGVDTLVLPLHRVYGSRLAYLLSGYDIVEEAFFAKVGGVDKYTLVDKDFAMTVPPVTTPPCYYAIGCFVLRGKSHGSR